MNREEAILRELKLYPLWQRRVQTGAVTGQVSMGPTLPDRVTKSGLEKMDSQDMDSSHWSVLRAMVKSCAACRLRAGCSQTVLGAGDVRADWMFVGISPGLEEDAQGKPFCGQSGRLLDNMLSAIQLRRAHNVYLADMVKCCPPGNRMPDAGEIVQCLPYLEREIYLVQPKLIMALGKAAALLLGLDSDLPALRGRLHDYRIQSVDGRYGNIPLVATYHPADLLQTPLKKAESWEDLCLAVETMQRLVTG
ncbi:uracil-DNA glycosylase [Candidatus Nitrotoga fabula]|uniref:Type-4 uracil-DNA glycosylase n=1 Tax=Candidatus Nitrotoga fabula TaxID=2182327 RepID=A0A916BDQ4_9PROT|nr:uracil-DNA glycosylase [Candidatus Nitrotoga fabula]CAE6730145.1 Type-4 uracil-DNA glycosylase [Candidatus Nitrotoga fabula]